MTGEQLRPWPHKKVRPGGCHPLLQGYFASSRGEERVAPSIYRPQMDGRFMEAWLRGYDEHVEFKLSRKGGR